MLKLGSGNVDDNGYGGLVNVIDQLLEALAWDDRGYTVQEVRSLSGDDNKLGMKYLCKDE